MPRKKKIDYNEEPVYYCKHCLSLKIMDIQDVEDSDYCDECGFTDIESTSIENWDKLYKEKYGYPYLIGYKKLY